MKNGRDMLRRLRHRALARGIGFSLSRPVLKKMLKCVDCPICGVRFVHEQNHKHEISIDRIVPALGYTDANTAAICRTCNGLKADLDPDRLDAKGHGYIATWVRNTAAARSLPLRLTLAVRTRRALAHFLRQFASKIEG